VIAGVAELKEQFTLLEAVSGLQGERGTGESLPHPGIRIGNTTGDGQA